MPSIWGGAILTCSVGLHTLRHGIAVLDFLTGNSFPAHASTKMVLPILLPKIESLADILA